MTIRDLPSETAELVLRHRVVAVHDTTGAPVPIRAEVEPPLPNGWVLRRRRSDVLISAWSRAADLHADTRVTLTVADPSLKARLVTTEATGELAGAQILHRFVPRPSQLQVELRRPDDDPSTGKMVRARGRDGSVVALQEVEPGIYRSDPTTWSSQFHPVDVVVDGTPVHKVVLDIGVPTTRVRLIDSA